VFRDNIALHNANGVIGQSLAVGNGVGFRALIRAMDPEVASSLARQAGGDPSGRPGDRARGRPRAYIR
jgi:hypothetical protein